MSLPEDIRQRVVELEQFHQSTKYNESARPPTPDPATRPKPWRIFEDHPKTPLPTNLVGTDIVATVSLLGHRPEAIPESELNPPHDLRTLATWLFMSYGITHKQEGDNQTQLLRSAPSAGHAFPCEIYVAAFAIEGLEPGLYHYCPREFSLRKLRDGDQAFVGIAHAVGSADLIRRAPAALLVSTLFSRSAWGHGDRAYRLSLLDAGHLVENLMVSAAGLGISTLITLHPNADPSRRVVGVPADAPFADAEAVQALIVWANESERDYAPQSTELRLEPIARPAQSGSVASHDAILRAQAVCLGKDGLVREVGPPLTEMSPLSDQLPAYERPPHDDPHGGKGLGTVLRTRRSAREFHRTLMPKEQFLWLNLVGFRGAAYWPLHPAEGHAALVRPFWLINGVRGIDAGIWFYDPTTNKWATLARGESRMEAAYLCLEQQIAADASAICFIAANLHLLMAGGGPDTYRLAHLEAGIVAHRMQLAAAALDLGSRGIGTYLDDELRKFLGLEHTRWEVLYATAFGAPKDIEHPTAPDADQPKSDTDEATDWRD